MAGCCRALHRFRERAPRIDLVLRTSRQLMDFRRDAIDLAIRLSPAPARGLHGEALCQEELFPVASPSLFGGRRTPDTLAALAEYPLLHDTDANPEQPWLGWRGWFERAGLATTASARGMQFSDSIVLHRGGGRGPWHCDRPRAARRTDAGARSAHSRDARELARALEILSDGPARAFPAAGGTDVRRLGARRGAQYRRVIANQLFRGASARRSATRGNRLCGSPVTREIPR